MKVFFNFNLLNNKEICLIYTEYIQSVYPVNCIYVGPIPQDFTFCIVLMQQNYM